MFRKIRSERAPEKTLWRDLRDELAPYINSISGSVTSFFRKFPRTVFVGMVIILIYSILWSFKSEYGTSQQKRSQSAEAESTDSSPLVAVDGVNSISSTAKELRRTMAIRGKVDSILEKKNLSRADSAFLEEALRELKQIQRP